MNTTNFSLHLKEKHYSHETVRQYCSSLDKLSINEKISEPLQLFEHINNLLELFRPTASRSVYHNVRAAAGRYFEMVTGKSFLAFGKKSEINPVIKDILAEFEEYSVAFKKIKPSTAKAECSHVCTFLSGLKLKSYDSFTTITVYEVRDYAINSLALLKASSAGRYITSLRNFFRFLEYKGVTVNPSIFSLPLSAVRREGNIPVMLSPEEEKRLRTHPFSNDERGARNKAILLLMLDLGLRCIEISGIRLSDIRWGEGTIIIRNAKNNTQRELPMSSGAGRAVEAYVLFHRPRTQEDHLFLNIKPCSCHSPVTVETVRSLIRYLYKREDISGWWKGTHAIRRTTASNIYNAGNGLKATADILGHDSIRSTTHYVKVDFDALAEIPQEWPEEVEQ